MLLVARPRRPKGVLAGPGTPRDPKSHLFVTKWVAVAPFGTLKPGSGSEFRPGSRRGGPGAQIPTFFSPILDPKMPKSRFSGRVSNLSATHSNGFGAPGAQGGPRGQGLGSLKVWPGSLKVWPGSLEVWPSSLKVWPSSSYGASRSYGASSRYGVRAAKPRARYCWRHSSCWRHGCCWTRL